MDYPDENLGQHQLTLEEFVKVAQHLSSQGQGINSDAFIRFVLAGRYPDGVSNQSSRIFINARQGAFLPDDAVLQRYSDVDSVIGITRDLPYSLPMAIFPLASFRDTLTEDVHIKYPMSPLSVPVSGMNEFLCTLSNNITCRLQTRSHFTRSRTWLWGKWTGATSHVYSFLGFM
jgi:hypothetical protein